MAKYTEEAWLYDFMNELRPDFAKLGSPLPANLQINTSFAGRGSKRIVGQYWPPTDDRARPVIFVSPRIAGGQRAAATLVHELCHAAARTSGHRGDFARLARAMGLDGPLTATYATKQLEERVNAFELFLGQPWEGLHAAVDPLDNPSRQINRNLLVRCPGCDSRWRASKSTILAGLPYCGHSSHSGTGPRMVPAQPIN